MDEANDLDEPMATYERSLAELRLKTQANREAWGFGDTKTWSADLDTGIITFVTKDDRVVTAPVQVIGTYSSEDGTWLWGWDHPSVGHALAFDARLAKEFGERYDLEWSSTKKLICTEDEAWTFTALACHLAGAQGAYRGPAGSTYVFMTFGDVTMNRSN
jgi:hypothetical protein